MLNRDGSFGYCMGRRWVVGVSWALRVMLLLLCLVRRIDDNVRCFADSQNGELGLMKIRLEQLCSCIVNLDSVQRDPASIDESSGLACRRKRRVNFLQRMQIM